MYVGEQGGTMVHTCWHGLCGAVGLGEKRVTRLGEEDNFWGPAGGSGASSASGASRGAATSCASGASIGSTTSGTTDNGDRT